MHHKARKQAGLCNRFVCLGAVLSTLNLVMLQVCVQAANQRGNAGQRETTRTSTPLNSCKDTVTYQSTASLENPHRKVRTSVTTTRTVLIYLIAFAGVILQKHHQPQVRSPILSFGLCSCLLTVHELAEFVLAKRMMFVGVSAGLGVTS